MKKTIINGLYKWLPIVFGCHCRKDRSFFWHGIQFPLCARCTGELFGMTLAILSMFFYRPPLWAVCVGMLPLVIDGFVQLKTSYESTNIRRVVTGVVFGYCFTMFFAITLLATYWWGVDVRASIA